MDFNHPTAEDLLEKLDRAKTNIEIRNQIILEFKGLISFLAKRYHQNYSVKGSCLEISDLESVGVMGLIDAINKFSPLKKIKFKTYAEFRIKGQMIDHVRSLSFFPRSVLDKKKKLEKILVALRAKFLREPTVSEICEHSGLSLEEYYDLSSVVSDLQVSSIESMTDRINTHGDHDVASDVVWDLKRSGSPLYNGVTHFCYGDHDVDDPAFKMMEEDLREKFINALGSLSERNKQLLSMYYYQGFSMYEIGIIFGCTESRVSQLHTKAKEALKKVIFKDKALCAELEGFIKMKSINTFEESRV